MIDIESAYAGDGVEARARKPEEMVDKGKDVLRHVTCAESEEDHIVRKP